MINNRFLKHSKDTRDKIGDSFMSLFNKISSALILIVLVPPIIHTSNFIMDPPDKISYWKHLTNLDLNVVIFIFILWATGLGIAVRFRKSAIKLYEHVDIVNKSCS